MSEVFSNDLNNYMTMSPQYSKNIVEFKGKICKPPTIKNFSNIKTFFKEDFANLDKK